MSKNLFSRRNFIKKSALTGIGATTVAGYSFGRSRNLILKETNEAIEFSYPSSATKRLIKLLNIKYPIVQAPTAGVVTTALVSEVTKSGALGGLPLTWTTPKDSRRRIKDVQKITNGSFYANFVLNFEPKALDSAIKSGIKIIQFSWGIPSKQIVQKIKRANIILGIQVTSEDSAISAIHAGADYLVCQGTEAGGHVHASRPLHEALEEVLAVAGNIPVVASGGIATGKDIYTYLSLGAAGVVMGSRFVATEESSAHPKYKQALINSSAKDTVFTVCLNKGWSNATHRIIRNKTFKMWEAAGCPVEGNRPNENEVLVTYKDSDATVTRYEGNVPNTDMMGKVEEIGMYAGKGVGHINDIPTVAELINSIWNEFLNK
ncbi:NAD(P)H-dependent flavin oxidoreductase [Spongiimicrobium sp. 3-5]|uniref:NAD(P)H-dependent flavin oxidoreductase n=1 Tax=Spongiimicrobium sp. 3-5 TaxID=3332596 RepID=UPI0039806713